MYINIIKQIQKNKKYAFYALSIVFSRGLEYLVLFYAALFLSKENYGELEFYKKLIELFAVALAFGFPSLLLTYTKSKNSKVYLNLLSLFFITGLSLILFPILLIFKYQFIVIPVLFHAIFFNNGIMPIFFITKYGSNQASIYKSIISIIFYLGVLLLIIYHPNPERAFVTINYYLIFFGGLFLVWLYRTYNLRFNLLKKYYKLFKKLLLSSLTLVVSNFANLMFLYTDIMILKSISNNSNIDIANYSFALNIANMLILIPLTLVQVDIEELKAFIKIKAKASRILKLVLGFSVLILLGYIILVHTAYLNYKETLGLFLIILGAKIFQSQSTLFGTLLLIKKRFRLNLKINIAMVILNILLSYLCFNYLGIYGVALASLVTLLLRLGLLINFSKDSIS